MPNRRKKIFVGMSGGVDSSVAAALLLEQGHEVVGAFMKNWSESAGGASATCSWEDERRDALRVAAQLGIPFMTFDFEAEYRASVVEYLHREYQAGRTPNPDVLCNKVVKFDLFLHRCLEEGADMIATGHYARIGVGPDGAPQLLAGSDPNKDQSYFLHQLTEVQLAKTLFPVGHLRKSEVRDIARRLGLPTAEKKDSTGICFIGNVEMKDFLAKRTPAQPGRIVTTDGREVGTHSGAAAFTIGQRHGLAQGGGKAFFVVEKNVRENIIVVAENEQHPALFSTTLATEPAHWVSGAAPAVTFRCQARIRYRQPLQQVAVQVAADGSLALTFDVQQRAAAPGQFVVLYDGEHCLGGAVINPQKVNHQFDW